jgi:hypothetical protein
MATSANAHALDATTPVQIHAAGVATLLVHGGTEGMAYLGPSNVTGANGTPVPPRTTLTFQTPAGGDLYAIASKPGYTLRVTRIA